MTYGIGVYDITKFIPQHPGSDKVMLAAGGAIDPFWHTYQQHNTTEILNLLETYRIGNFLILSIRVYISYEHVLQVI